MLKYLLMMMLVINITGCVVSNVIPGVNSLPEERLINGLSGDFVPGKLYIGEKRGFKHSLGRDRVVIKDAAAENYANRILYKLKRVSGVKKLPGKVYFNARNYLAAESTPNGNIFIDYGVFDALDNEDQFAAILAHELSHVILKHHDSDVYLKHHKRLVRLSNLLNQLKQKVDKLRNSGSSNSELAMVDHLTNSFLLADGAVFPIWNRKQELDADTLAFELLVKSKYNTEEQTELFLKIEANDKLEKKNKAEEAHARIIAAQKLGVEALVSAVGKTVIQNIGSIFSSKHPSIKTRKDYMVNYTNKFEVDLVDRLNTVRSWNNISKRGSTKRVLNSLKEVNKALGYIRKSELTKADYQLGLTGVISSQPYSRIAKASLRSMQRRRNEEISNYSIASKSTYSPFKVHVRLYELSKGGRTKFRSLYQTFKKYDKPPNYYPLIIKYAKETNNLTLAKGLEKECLDKYSLEDYSCLFADSSSGTGLSFKSYLRSITE
jgi:hypothetical protein